MVAVITREVKGLSDYLNSDDYSDACDDAAREVGIAFPITGTWQIYWAKQRALRHVLFHLVSESAFFFKFKTTFLNQRFDHLLALIKHMDEKWADAQTEVISDGVDDYALFGHKVDAGFAYEPQTGRDFSYDEEQKVIVNPNESS